MNVITVSREFGAGGAEVARRVAAALGWELLDRELLHQAAALEHVPDAELERLDEHPLSLADRWRRHPPHERYLHGLTEAARQAAAHGRVVLVGRGTRQLLDDTADALHLRLVAPVPWRAERMARLESTTVEQASARCAEVDRTRAKFTYYFFGADALRPDQYDLVVNTGRVPLEAVVAWVTAIVRDERLPPAATGSTGRRVLTLARELGAAESGFARSLAARLGLQIHDRDLLDLEAARLGVTAGEMAAVDEQPAGILSTFLHDSLSQRYHAVLGQLITDLAAREDVLLVGRGGSRFLRDRPEAFHVRLVASMAVRVRRVMEHRWLCPEPARQMIDTSDARRGRFYAGYFSADWADPLEYHVTVNTGRLGAKAANVVTVAAERHWRLPA